MSWWSEISSPRQFAYFRALPTSVWATVQNDYTDKTILATLTNFPLSDIVNYLAQFPHQNLGLPVLSSVLLPNPTQFIVGSAIPAV